MVRTVYKIKRAIFTFHTSTAGRIRKLCLAPDSLEFRRNCLGDSHDSTTLKPFIPEIE